MQAPQFHPTYIADRIRKTQVMEAKKQKELRGGKRISSAGMHLHLATPTDLEKESISASVI